MKASWGLLVAVCALVIGAYAYIAQSGILELLTPDPAESYYNLLVEGFRAGHLSLNKAAPLGLTQLADPYDPVANQVYKNWPYRMLDMSYYKGRLYLYFGVTPALLLFWPFAAVTGEYLFHREAVAIFCAVGFLTSVGLLRALWRRYFSEVSVGVVVAGAVGLGFATGVPLLLSQADVYEVAISCGHMLTMLALGAVWCALHEPERRGRWLAAASVAYGLAVGARPSLLFGGIVLLAPVVQAWRERRQMWVVLMAAIVPITLIGLGLMAYNKLRFDSPLDFGWRYELTWERQITRQLFSWRYLWFNFCLYFLEPARWSARFPFVHEAAAPPTPVGYGQVRNCFGVLTNVPLVWLALAAPLAWRNRSSQSGSVLRLFVAATAVLFGVCALTLGLFCASNPRYEVDFLPALVLLAVIGILGLERELAPASKSGLAGRRAWRRPARCGWSILLGFSVAFGLLSSVRDHADAHNYLGNAQEELGNWPEAIRQFELTVRLDPDFAIGQNNLGGALLRVGRPQEAIGHFQEAVRTKPDFADAHCNLAVALSKVGRLPEAIGEYQQGIRLKPDSALGHNNFGSTLWQAGKVAEAIGEYKQALRINPDYVEAHYNLGLALEKMGRTPEAIQHYQQALKLQSDFAPARNALTRLGAGQ